MRTEPRLAQPPPGRSQAIGAPAAGLSPGTRYRFRLTAENANGDQLLQRASPSNWPSPGSRRSARRSARRARRAWTRASTRTASRPNTASNTSRRRLSGQRRRLAAALRRRRDDARRAAGSGGLIELASETVEHLDPATDLPLPRRRRKRRLRSGDAEAKRAPDAPAPRTRRSPTAPTPARPASDRAWEQVNLPDTGGNPVRGAAGIAADGESALYRVFGGTPVSESGHALRLPLRPPPGRGAPERRLADRIGLPLARPGPVRDLAAAGRQRRPLDRARPQHRDRRGRRRRGLAHPDRRRGAGEAL